MAQGKDHAAVLPSGAGAGGAATAASSTSIFSFDPFKEAAKRAFEPARDKAA